MTSDRSVKVGRDALANVVTTGDRNAVDANIEAKVMNVSLPRPDEVNLTDELAKIKVILKRVGGEHAAKVGRALEDANDEAKKKEPNKDEIGAALSRALEYARKVNSFAEETGELAPRLTNVVAWLGSNWYKLLSIVGLAV